MMDRNRSMAWPLGVGVLLVVLAIFAVALPRPEARASAPAFHGTPYNPPAPAPAFTLTAHTGVEVSLADYRGDPVLLFFGFTHCPDVCPMTLSRLSRILGDLGEEAVDVRVLLVTVDPERDTPAVLAEYVKQFGPRVTGLTGDSGALRRIREEYGVYAAPRPATPGTHPAGSPSEMAHTDAIFGIDREGRIRVLMHPDAPEEQLRDDIRALPRL